MKTNDRFLQELPSPSERDNSIDEELNELELDAIAGGCSDMADRARAAGMPVITTNSPRPNIFGRPLPMQFIEAASRAFGNSN
jgi:rRNA-processing protein FCF1